MMGRRMGDGRSAQRATPTAALKGDAPLSSDYSSSSDSNRGWAIQRGLVPRGMSRGMASRFPFPSSGSLQ